MNLVGRRLIDTLLCETELYFSWILETDSGNGNNLNILSYCKDC